MNQTNKEIAKGAAWILLFKFIDRGIGLMSALVLARLLVPADFGLIAIAVLIINALALLINFNFDVHLIQRRRSCSARTQSYFMSTYRPRLSLAARTTWMHSSGLAVRLG